MNMDKEKNINEILNSLDGIQKAGANPFLFEKISNKINSPGLEKVPLKFVWLTAFAFVILLLLNFLVFKTINFKQGSENTGMTEVVSQLQLVNTNSINYNQ